MNIGIVGVGLLGSSLARAFAEPKLGATISVYDTNKEYLEKIDDLGLGAQIATSLDNIAKNSEIIFVCTPVSEIANIICYLIQRTSSRSIVTDVGSVKRPIIEDVARRFPDYTRYVPGHPISGGAKSGPDSGRADLFDGKSYFLTPYDKTDAGATEMVSGLLASIGAVVSQMKAARHDDILSFVSHLPHVYAFALMNASHELSLAFDDDILKYAGRSFCEITQFATADKKMWTDIFIANADSILENNKVLLQQISAFAEAIKERDAAQLSDLIEAARRLRLGMDRKGSKK
jgi:cyclohexadieny/prephenate dehydrogenase